MSAFEYTSQNHFQFGYRDPITLTTRWMNRRFHEKELFTVRYGRATRHFATWREANREAARLILSSAHSKGLSPIVCYSGGLDSEIMLTAFLEAALEDSSTRPNSPFSVATLNLIDSNGQALNAHDTDYIRAYRESASQELDRLRVSFRSHDLNLEEFWPKFRPEFRPGFQQEDLTSLSTSKLNANRDSLLSLADETQIVSPQLLCHIWLCEQIHKEQIQNNEAQALPIIGQGELYLAKTLPPHYVPGKSEYAPSTWSVVETENLCGLYRFFIGRNRPAIPGFFQYLPEQFETHLRLNPVLHELISHRREGKLSTRTSKPDILAHDYPELEPRPKFTGFEKVDELHTKWRQFLSERRPACESKWEQDVYALYRDLQPLPQDGPLRFADWQAAWGMDGRVSSRRVHHQDVFATEWVDSQFPRKAWTKSKTSQTSASSDDLVSALLPMLLPSPQTIPETTLVLLDDGSPFAHLLQEEIIRKATSCKLTLIRPTGLEPLPSVFETLANGGDADIDAILATLRAHLPVHLDTTNPLHVIIPRFGPRLGSRIFEIDGRTIWLENERSAFLTRRLLELQNSLKANSLTWVLPWTHSAFTELALSLGERNELAASVSASECSSEFETLKSRIQAELLLRATPANAFQASAFDLTNGDTGLTGGLAELAALAAPALSENRDYSLRVVPTSRWLEAVTLDTPETRLGSNLFFQQRLSGLALLRPETRISFALVSTRDETEVAWAHIHILKGPPHGSLRVRGVVTRPDLRRQGLATLLLRELTTRLTTQLKTARLQDADFLAGYQTIEVYASKEIRPAFSQAGFQDDPTRPTKAEDIYDPKTDRLVSGPRLLYPMKLIFAQNA
ncbi:MAG: hypothetical protein RBT63_02050 [Bdellovibrionales bacterium]|jgi:GNAT superfamily N-acetyltransferase|nr:hypothetical protein [Bdellovibrionales bacterium]